MQGEYANVVLTGLQHADGAENPSGIAEIAYILPYSEIATIQEPTVSTGPASLLTIATAHVMATGKAPIAATIVYEKGDFESKLEGEIYSKMFNPSVTLFIPQPTAENAGNLSALKNARALILIKRPTLGNFYQIGGKYMAAKVKDGSVKFGKGPTGEPGIMITYEAHSTQPYFYYTAVLPVTGA